MDRLKDIANYVYASDWFDAAILLIIGFIIARFISSMLVRLLRKRLSPHQQMLVKQIAFYFLFILFFVSAIQQMGFQISALLGATGILTVAIGIASQTSMSNVISGIFIIGEKPFEIGDTVLINNLQGEVMSIDFLSVKIRTTENTMVRIPNETLIKSAVTNLSYFPVRRVDIALTLSYYEDAERVRIILIEIAKNNSYCLKDPAPTVSIDTFNESGTVLILSCWGTREDIKELKNTLQQQINKAIQQSHIQIGFPTRMMYNSSNSLSSE